MAVQDDVRERELSRLFNLIWSPSHERGGIDAHIDLDINGQRVRLEVEVKSTTKASVSTARDFGLDHIKKWRGKLWVIGYYARSHGSGLELTTSLCLTPNQMEPWIKQKEDSILPDFVLAGLASSHLTLQDLGSVCGVKEHYTIADAKRLHKRQWTAAKYAAQADIMVKGKPMYSPARMLEVLQQRAVYIAERGATVNNPHIPKSFLRQFLGTSAEVRQNWAQSIREIGTAYIHGNPSHPFQPPSVTAQP